MAPRLTSWAAGVLTVITAAVLFACSDSSSPSSAIGEAASAAQPVGSEPTAAVSSQTPEAITSAVRRRHVPTGKASGSGRALGF